MEDKFCILPFVQLDVQPQGEVSVCCYSSNPKSLGNLKEEEFSIIWRSEELSRFRETILSGNIDSLDHCSSCMQSENLGIRSWREIENSNWKVNSKKEVVKKSKFPESLSLRFSNVCNFSCRTCRPSSSTGWFDDAKLLNPKGEYFKVLSYEENNPISSQVEEYLPFLKHIYFAGGEALLDKDHYILLEKISNEYPDIVLTYDTNLSVLGLGKYDVIELWRKIKNVRVSASIDGFGKKGEYIRKGFSWETFLSNWNLLKTEAPNVELRMNFTVNIYNIIHICEFIDEVNRLDLFSNNNPDDLYFCFVDDPSWLSIKYLSKINKLKIKDILEEYNRTNTFGRTKEYIEDIITFMNEETNDQEKVFKQYTKRLDFLRSEKYTEIFDRENDILSFI
jgi:radical SAM protein with 4Fe4S-binding SPASM domain